MFCILHLDQYPVLKRVPSGMDDRSFCRRFEHTSRGTTRSMFMGRGTRPFTFSSILVQSSVFYRLAFSAKVELTRAAVLPLLAQIHGLNLDTLDSYSDSWGPVGPESVTTHQQSACPR